MKKKSMKLKKSGSIGNEAGEHNIWYTEKVMEINMINGSQNWGCLMQGRQLKTIG